MTHRGGCGHGGSAFFEEPRDQAEYAADVADGEVTSISDDRAAADTATDKTEPGDKPQA
jgi:preprotein translocase subunit YajC